MLRQWIRASVSVAALAGFAIASDGAHAQAYPTRDVYAICAAPTGSGADVLVRYFAEKLRPLMGKNIIVENKVGAGGNMAQEYVGRAKPDGYTLFVHAGSSVAANRWLFKNPTFTDIGNTFQVAATINLMPFMMVVDPKSPYMSVADITAAMKAKGDKGSYATAGSTGTVMGELYKAKTGTEAVEVSYRAAADALNDMASGSIQYAMFDPIFSLAQQREGRVRILGVSTAKRLEALPDLPTMAEQGVDMDLTSWFAFLAPQGTPKPIVDQLNQWVSGIVSQPETKAFLKTYGGDPMTETPEQGQARLLKDVDAWKTYIEVGKIQPQ